MTGAVVGGLIGVMVAFSLAGLQLLQAPTIGVQLLTVAGAVVLGSLLLGPVMKYLFNSPEMHIWHHAHDLPEERRYGVNFGLTLALWDYLWKTDYIPEDGRDIKLGFPGVETFPQDFVSLNMVGFGVTDYEREKV